MALSGIAATEHEKSTRIEGVPSGFLGRPDDSTARIDQVKYRTTGDRWEITTGPAHIMYALDDTLKGPFTVASTFELMEAPTQAEAFGLFIGGTNLDQPEQRYSSFMVRGDGQYLIKVRDGSGTRDVVPWTSSDAIARQDARGHARYRLAIRVGADSVRFLCNGATVTALPIGAIPTDGITGLRINHGLRVTVDRLRVGR